MTRGAGQQRHQGGERGSILMATAPSGRAWPKVNAAGKCPAWTVPGPGQHLVDCALAEQVQVVDAVRAGHYPGHDQGHLGARVAPGRAGTVSIVATRAHRPARPSCITGTRPAWPIRFPSSNLGVTFGNLRSCTWRMAFWCGSWGLQRSSFCLIRGHPPRKPAPNQHHSCGGSRLSEPQVRPVGSPGGPLW